MSSSDTELRSAAGRVGPADDRPLSEQEFQLLQRLLADPFSFPNQYKTWLVSYLETSDMSLPISAVQGLSAILGISGVGSGTLGILPAGIIFPFGGVSPPTGSLLCNGNPYSRTVQKRLYDAIGTTYGAPDAASFNVPDLQERIPVGRGVKAGMTALGQNEGRALGQRGPVHGHTKNGTVTLSDPGHHHTYGRAGGATTGGAGPQAAADTAPMTTAESATGITISDTISVGPQSGVPVDTPAFLTVNFIIVN